MKRQIYPEGTIVRIKKTDQLAIIIDVCYLCNNPENFLHYRVKYAGGKGPYAAYPDDLELLVLPRD
ncbi:MAG TPA: hypothetical protein VF691_13405 [Cytophagaceae bacterium]|jgi:hypothetical protein